MRIVVMDQEAVQKYSNSSHQETSAIISIYSARGRKACIKPSLRNNIKELLYLCFDDATMYDGGAKWMSQLDAAMLVDFALHWRNEDVDILIIQCEYGEGRSVGCAEALSEYFFNTHLPEEVTENMNVWCYNRTKRWLDHNHKEGLV